LSGTDSLEHAYAAVGDFARRHGIPVLTGAITSSLSETDGYFQNSILLFEPGAALVRAAKNILVPFAEHVPLSGSLPWLRRFAVPAGGVVGYAPGHAPSVVKIHGAPVGVMVCFESAFPGYARRLESLGSEFFVVLTQDGWWRGNGALSQHFAMARFRAAETGRFLVQVGVTGITGLVDDTGRKLSVLPARIPGTTVYRIPLRSNRTVQARLGRWTVPVALGIWMVLIGLYGLRLREKSVE
jgi:apolipoprotein N-acyltransferase